MVAVAKRELFTARPKMFVQRWLSFGASSVFKLDMVPPLQDHGLEYNSRREAAT